MLIGAFALGCGDDDAGVGVDAGGGEDAGMVDDDAGGIEDAGGEDAPDLGPRNVGGDRPTRVFRPFDYDPETPAPLILLLHGYGADGATQDIYFLLTRAANQRGAFALRPDGTENAGGERFWNATPACCDFGGSGVDDVAYLVGLVDEMKANFNIDANRVYAIGHSNGHFMSYRLACDAADTFTAIAGLAGATYWDDADCDPSQPVSALHMHGTADTTISYDGQVGGYPGAEESLARFAARGGCTGTTMGENLDLVSTVPGAETVVTQHTGCDESFAFELWRMEGAGHIPGLERDTIPMAVEWLLARSR